MSWLYLEDIERRFAEHVALDGVSLQIEQGEFFSLLGPSGCGKTTLLNIIAGFLAPGRGAVSLGGRDITPLPPYQRAIGMVFQNYALFPHLSVFDNVAYGLKVKKLPRKAIAGRVKQVLELVRLEALGGRMPHQLSGGQQQRVAIARALAIEPQVLLLDEPLSNLDAKLRKEMQDELRALQRRVGITTILVTHDQEEALTLSDRIGILGQGRLQQVGTPLTLYRQPANRFVAEFIGQANLFDVRAAGDEGEFVAQRHFSAADRPLRLRVKQPTADAPSGLMLRPERIRITTEPSAEAVNRTPAILREASYTGAVMRLRLALPGGGELLAHSADGQFDAIPAPGTPFTLSWRSDDVIALPNEAEAR
ncbi:MULTISPECIES: ABC transporter ATP-binding protein [Brenneria]|uniref:Spermidine/putrescine import ATP-binding protein PotA n=1 Tax=Brenneria nigrifluens DSM 30175 = ATCC 13028 TaxID=1121120 RepID=A0A2U1UB04_9GAMM|nr:MULTISPECIES: ABC transporter ATP-binding protein [Brenneria]EHD21751.1 spermidine/putrescine ABC transporter ATPase subunit [Brenneria sp. EniD312]PWC18744.1 polyamine ABC transporter ATP-binding protein [Brenneria nigrifluens DSM 30175 = ATCC 13028]QCR04862.1 ABC transporter ATP-binding protein [Brenneria nigrifluens DSM 30175 = ATCC 13028]